MSSAEAASIRQFHQVASADAVRKALTHGPWDLVISDFELPRHDFPEVLKSVREHDVRCRSSSSPARSARKTRVLLMREGVADFALAGQPFATDPDDPSRARGFRCKTGPPRGRPALPRHRRSSPATGFGRQTRAPLHLFLNGFRDGKGQIRQPVSAKTRWELAGVDPKEDEDWQAPFRRPHGATAVRATFFFSYVRSLRNAPPVFQPMACRSSIEAALFAAIAARRPTRRGSLKRSGAQRKRRPLLRDAVESISEGISDPRSARRPHRHWRTMRSADSIPHRRILSRQASSLRTSCAPPLGRNVYPMRREARPNGSPTYSRIIATRAVDNRELADGRWVLVTERRLSNGGIAGLEDGHHGTEEGGGAARLLAYHDPLTGLPNPVVLADRLGQAMTHVKSEGGPWRSSRWSSLRCMTSVTAWACEPATRPIREVGNRIRNRLRDRESVTHVGAGQFLVLCVRIASDSAAISSIERFLNALTGAFEVSGREVPLRIAAGISTAPGDAIEPEVVIRNATTAMHRAEDRPTQRYQFYNPEMTRAAVARAGLENDLRHAIENDELLLVYQPQVHTHTSQARRGGGAVALAPPARSILHQDELLPMAEETGLIVPIGEHVLRLACRQAAAWRRWAVRIPISFSISAAQLQAPNLEKSVMASIDRGGDHARCHRVGADRKRPSARRGRRNQDNAATRAEWDPLCAR